MNEKKVLLLQEFTPNPNAIRYVSNLDFSEKACTIKRSDIRSDKNKDIELVDKLLEIDDIEELFLFQNFVTILKKKDSSWSDILKKAKVVIETYLPFHNPEFKVEQLSKRVLSEEEQKKLDEIEEILDREVRPSLQEDGGNLEVVDLDNNVLTVKYLGACGSCPSAFMGTLQSIEGILKERWNEIKIKVIDNIFHS